MHIYVDTHMQTAFISLADEICRNHRQLSGPLLTIRIWDTPQRKSQLTACYSGGAELHLSRVYQFVVVQYIVKQNAIKGANTSTST